MRAEFQIENQRLGGQGPERIAALDALRGLAVLGMYIQHFALNEWNGDLVSGNTMILFMMCSGMSYALMEQSVRQRRRNIKKLRVRILARSLAIDLAGYCLLLLNGPFGMVLPAYAMLFLGAMPLLRCGKGQLIGISGKVDWNWNSAPDSSGTVLRIAASCDKGTCGKLDGAFYGRRSPKHRPLRGLAP